MFITFGAATSYHIPCCTSTLQSAPFTTVDAAHFYHIFANGFFELRAIKLTSNETFLNCIGQCSCQTKSDWHNTCFPSTSNTSALHCATELYCSELHCWLNCTVLFIGTRLNTPILGWQVFLDEPSSQNYPLCTDLNPVLHWMTYDRDVVHIQHTVLYKLYRSVHFGRNSSPLHQITFSSLLFLHRQFCTTSLFLHSTVLYYTAVLA